MKRNNHHQASQTITLHYTIQGNTISEVDTTQAMKVKKKDNSPINYHNSKILYKDNCMDQTFLKVRYKLSRKIHNYLLLLRLFTASRIISWISNWLIMSQLVTHKRTLTGNNLDRYFKARGTNYWGIPVKTQSKNRMILKSKKSRRKL